MTAVIQEERIDPTTKSGFLEIAGAFGRERAHEARVRAYEKLIERDSGFRWFSRKWERALHSARFDRDYEAANPDICAFMRDNGYGY